MSGTYFAQERDQKLETLNAFDLRGAGVGVWICLTFKAGVSVAQEVA